MKALRPYGVGSASARTLRERCRARLQVELLEARTLLSAYPLSPAEARHVYGVDQVSGNGAGQTIGIVDAYDDPNIASDLASFDSTYGLPAANFVKVKQTSRVRGNTGWGQEISLDVEWAHAIAPGAKIVLVEAASSSFSNLIAGVDLAVKNGASVVSMSWGGGEFSGETSYDSHFNVTGVTFVASSGDSPGIEYPAASPNVVGVGGTTLALDSNNNYVSETAWNNQYGASGGGTSSYETTPTYQSSLGYGHRSSPDVAYDADPATGFAVYDSYGAGGWGQYGGTSAGAPQWAALFALADQQRVAAGKGTLSGVSQTLPTLYSNASALHDVVGNGAISGYDQVTGLGSPKAAAIISALVNTTLAAAVSGPSSTPTGGGKGGTHKPHVVQATTASELALGIGLLPATSVNLGTSATAPPPVASVNLAMPSLPVRVAPVQTTNIESGGGDNALLLVEDDATSIPSAPTEQAPVPNQQPPLPQPNSPSVAPVRTSRVEMQSEAILWSEAATACFVQEQVVPAEPLTEDSTEVTASALDSVAVLAGCLVALGDSWERRSEESKQRAFFAR
jgi:hypothetical protein